MKRRKGAGEVGGKEGRKVEREQRGGNGREGSDGRGGPRNVGDRPRDRSSAEVASRVAHGPSGPSVLTGAGLDLDIACEPEERGGRGCGTGGAGRSEGRAERRAAS